MTDLSKIHPASINLGVHNKGEVSLTKDESKNYLYASISVIITFIILESFWLGYVQKNNWNEQIRDIQGSEPQYRKSSAIFAYVVMFTAVMVFGIQKVRKDNILRDSLLYGCLIGFVMYGVFNGTNYAIFKNYKFETFVSDLIWGIFISFISTLIGSYFLYNI